MMWEEAIDRLEWYQCHAESEEDANAFDMAINALRPVSRELVEKVWRGGWVPYLDGEHIMPERYYRCSKCGDRGYMRKRNFCPSCGAPMTDEAVEMVMERMKALYETAE